MRIRIQNPKNVHTHPDPDLGVTYGATKIGNSKKKFKIVSVFQIRILMDPYNRRPPGSKSGFAWTDADPDPGGEKVLVFTYQKSGYPASKISGKIRTRLILYNLKIFF